MRILPIYFFDFAISKPSYSPAMLQSPVYEVRRGCVPLPYSFFSFL